MIIPNQVGQLNIKINKQSKLKMISNKDDSKTVASGESSFATMNREQFINGIWRETSSVCYESIVNYNSAQLNPNICLPGTAWKSQPIYISTYNLFHHQSTLRHPSIPFRVSVIVLSANLEKHYCCDVTLSQASWPTAARPRGHWLIPW